MFRHLYTLFTVHLSTKFGILTQEIKEMASKYFKLIAPKNYVFGGLNLTEKI